ncbi:MAG TPA: ABC transporter permease [Planctomycetota bacterium]|jgi:ABC-type Na+ efflux pump permease subunit|nr:ABC transporter permease [Planctomycetota bacterium]
MSPAALPVRRPAGLSARAWAAGVRLVGARELAAYFDSAIAYVYTIGFVVLANAIFMNEFFLTGTVEMAGFFDRLPLLLAVFLPAVTMRLWAEERRQRTIELLLTLPLTPAQAVLGKYLAAMALYGGFLAGSLPILAMLLALGHPDLGRILGGYLGAASLGSLLIALGMLLSAVSGDQIVAFVLSAVAAFALVLTGNDRVVAVLDGLAPRLGVGTFLYESVSVVPPFDAFVRGLVDLGAIVYFAGGTALFLWLNARRLRRNRA